MGGWFVIRSSSLFGSDALRHVLAASLVLTAACGDSEGSSNTPDAAVDAATVVDAGSDAAAPPDGAPAIDGAISPDAPAADASPGPDATSMLDAALSDAAPPPDAAPPDAALPPDAAPLPDAAPPDATGGTVELVDVAWQGIDAGSFWMGSPNGFCPTGYPGGEGAACTAEPGRVVTEKLHYVSLTRGFELMDTEVTQRDFTAVMGWNPSNFGPNGMWGDCGPDCPVEQVTWYAAVAYANEVSKLYDLTPCYTITDVVCFSGSSPADPTDYLECFDDSAFPKGGLESATVTLNGVDSVYDCTGYRLPTESEWEYAARAGTHTAFYSGDVTNTGTTPLDPNLDTIAWYGGNSSHEPYSTFDCAAWYPGATTCGPQPVRGKTANAWGLYDMSGNQSEWVWDWIQGTYPDGTTDTPLVDPEGPATGFNRVTRGGNFGGNASYCRSAIRFYYAPDTSYGSFRLARTLP